MTELSTIADLIFIAFGAMVPITLAALGEIITERAGVVNIGLEGIMLISSLTAAIATYYTDNPYLGLLAGIATGLLIGFVHALISVKLKGNQIVSGIGINIFAYGIVVVALVYIWGNYGQSAPLTSIPRVGVGTYAVSPIFILTILLGIGLYFFLFRTTAGLKLRACGEDPRSAEAMGVKVELVRIIATTVGAAFSGLAGAYMSVDYIGQFTKEITSGRGFIALANVVFSNWNPLFALVGGFIFGFSDAVARYLEIILMMPGLSYLFKTIPYLTTLVIVGIFFKRARMPRALGKPYIKE